MPELTEKRVREIAQEELNSKLLDFQAKVDSMYETLSRLERILLGEEGISEDSSLKRHAAIAYDYVRRNSELKIVERALPALQWYEDMRRPEPGCSESKLETLGKIITAYGNAKWILGLFGVTSIATLIIAINIVVEFINKLT